MSKISKVLAHAEQRCQSSGARFTDKRRHVLTSLLASGKALSAYELVEACKNDHDQTLPPMSVYRILEFLEKEQLVHKLNLSNKYVACAHIACEHEHSVPQFLICSECQRVEEISVSQKIIQDLQNNVEQAGFHLISRQLEMECVCKKCMKKPNNL